MIEDKVEALLSEQNESLASAITSIVAQHVFDLINGSMADKSELMYVSASRNASGEAPGMIALTANHDYYFQQVDGDLWGHPTLLIDPGVLPDELLESIEGEGGSLFAGDRDRYRSLAESMRASADRIDSIITEYSDRITGDEA